MFSFADVHRHLEGEGHLPLLGGGRAVGAVALQVGDIRKPYSRNLGCILLVLFIPLQPGAARGHPHPGAPALLPHHHHHHPAQLLHDDHALQRADRVLRVSIRDSNRGLFLADHQQPSRSGSQPHNKCTFIHPLYG